MSKKAVVVLFGGKSSEHEISCISARTVIKAIPTDKYEIVRIGITKKGHWIFVQSDEAIEDGSWRTGKTTAVISPDASRKEVIMTDERGTVMRLPVDVVFPVLHGLYGEDGTVQGLLELAQIPYVGCGVLASAVSMDKVYTKLLVDELKTIHQAKYVAVRKESLVKMEELMDKIEKKISYPMFVKPSNAGSSKGISKAHNRDELSAALTMAAEHDRKILVEETIVGRELECAVLGTNKASASGVGEILSAAEFYDYDAKYNNQESKTVISPELPEGKEDEIRNAAKKIFGALDGYGLARVDFFLEEGTNRVVFNEINTMPGFTSISMYPMLWAQKGLEASALVEQLLDLAFERYDK